MKLLLTLSAIFFGSGVALFAALLVVNSEILAATGLIAILLGWLTVGIHRALLELFKRIDNTW